MKFLVDMCNLCCYSTSKMQPLCIHFGTVRGQQIEAVFGVLRVPHPSFWAEFRSPRLPVHLLTVP